MPLTRTFGDQFESSPATPIVFVVDDDISVRESLQLLIQCEGWHPETFASAQEFLDRPRGPVPSCLVLDVSLPGLARPQWSRLTKACRRRAAGYADHLHHGIRRRAHNGPSHEGRPSNRS
jgi:CheY-like chemotaxis protein